MRRPAVRLVVVRTLARPSHRVRPTPAVKPSTPTTLPYAKELLGVAGAVVAGVATVLASVAVWGSSLEHEPTCTCCSCAERVKIFDAKSKSYASIVGRDEFFMLIPLLRWYLLRHAEGEVLEVAAGTGVNFKHYPSKCTVTAIDASKEMLQVAKKNVTKNVLALKQINVASLPMPESFDTVVDSFGFCSFEDPVDALKKMQGCCKPHGQILLLEHGRSYYTWLNNILDKQAPAHLRLWGCNWNRDILDIAKSSGLQIDRLQRWHFGTTYLLIARPHPNLAAKE